MLRAERSDALLWCQRCKKWRRPDDLQHVTIKREHRWPGGASEVYLCWHCLDVLRSVCPDCAGMAVTADVG